MRVFKVDFPHLQFPINPLLFFGWGGGVKCYFTHHLKKKILTYMIHLQIFNMKKITLKKAGKYIHKKKNILNISMISKHACFR